MVKYNSTFQAKVTRQEVGGGGGIEARPSLDANWWGCIFIYSGSARLVSFEMKMISIEVSRAEPEYMNIPPTPQLAF